MDDYLDPYYSVYCFRLAYGGVIKPLPNKPQWVRVELGFKVMPPLDKRDVGRQMKNRIPSSLENKGSKARGEGMWQVKCQNCLGLGHRSNSPKCPLNGIKKRKSRAKKGKAGRPPSSSKGDATPSPSKRQKVVVVEGTSAINASPGPITRRQSQIQLTMGELRGTDQINISQRALTLSETGEGPSNAMTTPRKSPRKRLGLKKKITPRKGKTMDA